MKLKAGRGGREIGGKEPFQLRGRRAPLRKCHFSRDLHGEPEYWDWKGLFIDEETEGRPRGSTYSVYLASHLGI